MSRKFLLLHCFLLLLGYALTARAGIFQLPDQGDLIGKVEVAVIKKSTDFSQVARDYDLGYTELAEANPGINPNHVVAAGTALVIPNQHILPDAPRRGLVINLAEMRLYFYPRNTSVVVTHPLGIGREREDTPESVMKVIEHIPNPTWTPTDNMRRLRAEEGVVLPKSVAPGPENPLGKFAMRLSSPTYLIHGTNDPLGGIGRRSSSGCMRLYPEDIASLYQQVQNGTAVYIVNQPYKAGWFGQQLYIESHGTLADNVRQGDSDDITRVVNRSVKQQSVEIFWDKTMAIAGETQGVPQVIGRLSRGDEEKIPQH